MFLGGNGFAAKMICGSVPADADPLGPENAVVFTVGPLTDTLPKIFGPVVGKVISLDRRRVRYKKRHLAVVL